MSDKRNCKECEDSLRKFDVSTMIFLAERT